MSPAPSPHFSRRHVPRRRLAGIRVRRINRLLHRRLADSARRFAGGLADLLVSACALPAIKWPLALFLFGTLLAWVFSGHLAAGMPQIKKIYVFAELLVVFSSLRNAKWNFAGCSWSGRALRL